MFRLNERLGIELPDFPISFEHMEPSIQAHVVAQWERIRARIPDQIMRFESDINQLLQQIDIEEDWDTIVRHFHTISDLASRISDLNHWRRIDPHITA